MTRNVLLIGSVPLGSADAVFEAVAGSLDGLVRRIPDGENGKRLDWVSWQAAAFARIPFVESVAPLPPETAGSAPIRHLPQFRVRPGYPTAAVRFGPLGYADAAATSYRVFAATKVGQKIPDRCRFQVGMATALSVVGQYVDSGFQAAIEPPYEERLLQEVDEIVDTVPHDELAIQWNLATELSIFDGHRRVYFDKVADGLFERIVRLCERVPDGVQLGLHFCYHDFVHNGFPLPKDLDRLVDLANGVLGSVGRAIDWIHLPVPSARAEPRYFAPLRRMMLRPETELYLGLVHAADGLAGTRRRIEAAKETVADFGIACECGLGGFAPQEIDALLELHRGAAGSV